MDVSLTALLVTILIAILGFAFGYGVLTNKVNNHQKDIDDLKTSFDTIDKKLDSICEDVATIKGELKKVP